MDYSLYDLDYLVDQYEMMKTAYSHPDSFGQERIAKMRVAFASYDKDGNGVLDKNEIAELCRNHFRDSGISKKPNDSEVEKFFNNISAGGESRAKGINFEQFKAFMVETMFTRLVKPLEEYLTSQGFNL